MNILVIMTKKSVSRKKRGNKTKRRNLLRNRSYGSSRQTRVKRGGMLRHAAASAARAAAASAARAPVPNPNQFKTIEQLNTFFFHNIAPLFKTYEYHVTSSEPNPEDGNVVVYGQRHYNSPIPKELTDEFNELKSVIKKTKEDESNPVQISGRVIDLYKKVTTALEEQKKRNSQQPHRYPEQGMMFPSSNRRPPQIDNLEQYNLSETSSPFRGMDLKTQIVRSPFSISPVSNIDNSTPPHVGSKYANGDNVYINGDDNQVVTQLFPNSPNKTPPTTPLNSPGAPLTKKYNNHKNVISSPVPMHFLLSYDE
jgi:hypothetical protein